MKNKAVSLKSYHFQSEDKLFFDANIWLFIYGPQEQKNSRNMGIYSSAFRRILEAQSRIYKVDKLKPRVVGRSRNPS